MTLIKDSISKFVRLPINSNKGLNFSNISENKKQFKINDDNSEDMDNREEVSN